MQGSRTVKDNVLSSEGEHKYVFVSTATAHKIR